MAWLAAGTGAICRRLRILVVAALLGALGQNIAIAQTCGTDYTIKEGETLAQVAARVYGNPAQWTVIFYSNQDRLGDSVSLLQPGLALRLPCIGGALAAPALPPIATTPALRPADTGFIISSSVRRVEFLTADGFAPYTGRSLEGGSMITHVIDSAMGLIKEEAIIERHLNRFWEGQASPPSPAIGATPAARPKTTPFAPPTPTPVGGPTLKADREAPAKGKK